MKVDLSKVRKGPTEKQIDFIVRNNLMSEPEAKKLTFEQAHDIITKRLNDLRARRIADALDSFCAPGGEINGDFVGYDEDEIFCFDEDVIWPDGEPDLGQRR